MRHEHVARLDQPAAAHPDHVSRIVFLSPMSVTKDLNRQRAARLTSLLREPDIARMAEVERLWNTASDADLPALCRDSLLPVLKLYVQDLASLDRTRGSMCGYAPEALRHMNRVGATGVASLGDWDFRPLLRTIHVPTLVIEGEHTSVPLEDARAWGRTPPNGRLLLIPHAGHMNWLDQPDAVVAALDEFFRGNWPARAAR
jgi:proline iminopeptidase